MSTACGMSPERDKAAHEPQTRICNCGTPFPSGTNNAVKCWRCREAAAGRVPGEVKRKRGRPVKAITLAERILRLENTVNQLLEQRPVVVEADDDTQLLNWLENWLISRNGRGVREFDPEIYLVEPEGYGHGGTTLRDAIRNARNAAKEPAGPSADPSGAPADRRQERS